MGGFLNHKHVNPNFKKTRPEEAKTLSPPLVYQLYHSILWIWRYFMSYWNHRRICSTNVGFLPAVKRQRDTFPL